MFIPDFRVYNLLKMENSTFHFNTVTVYLFDGMDGYKAHWSMLEKSIQKLFQNDSNSSGTQF